MPLNLVLASASPRRRELLENAGVAFIVRPVDMDETAQPDESAETYVKRLAESKARAAWNPGDLCLGADTAVVIASEILGKPSGAAEAREMLAKLSGGAHEVLTGYCLFDGKDCVSGVETTKVFFRKLSPDEINTYAASGEPLDKAGAYGIQGLASRFVERIEGCYFNVVGLPVSRVCAQIDRLTLGQDHS